MTGALIALALHGVAASAFLGYEPARSALSATKPIMVDLIVAPRTGPRPERPVEIAPRPKPEPVTKPQPKPPEPQPIVGAPADAPSPLAAPDPPVPPQPEAAPVAAAPVPAPVALAPAAFNADYLGNLPPAYPALSRRLGEQGRVILRVLVNAAGSADEVQIRGSSGHPRLDQAARDTVRGWKFVPAKRGEQPVAAWVLVPISFRLDG